MKTAKVLIGILLIFATIMIVANESVNLIDATTIFQQMYFCFITLERLLVLSILGFSAYLISIILEK